jgi:hypothetical protein
MISKYFSLEELIASDTASRKHIDNTPTAEHLQNLTEMAQQADRVREFLGHPMIVTSGYRGPKLNAAIGGSKTSSHMTGHAMDFRCPGFGTAKEVFEALKKSDIEFDQLILEFPDSPGAWVHIGFAPEFRHQYLVYDGQYRIA